MGEIQVTGTRIRRSNYATAKPVLKISRHEIESTGLTSIAQILAHITSASFSTNTTARGSSGASRINMRHLGSKRVLVLVNGHRWVPGIRGTVDLNTIPLGVIDHIEVLQDGAAATYGSDAIAGVINIITKRNFNGALAQAYYGIHHGEDHFGDDHWDGQVQRYEFTFGQTGGDNMLLADLSYYKQDDILRINRKISYYQKAGTNNAFGPSGTPQGNFQFYPPSEGDFVNPANGPAAFTGLTSAQCPTVNQGTAAAPHYVPFCHLTVTDGRPGDSPDGFRAWNPKTDPNNVAERGAWLLSPQHRASVFLQGRFGLGPSVELHTTAMYNQRYSTGWLYAQPIFVSSANWLPALIPKESPYNPFGFDLDATGGPNDNVVLLARSLVEGGGRLMKTVDHTLYFNTGFDGSFFAAGRQFNWSIDYLYGSTRSRESDFNLWKKSRAQEALNGTSAVCTEDCVPLNFFGGQYNGGTITPAMADYLRITEHFKDESSLRDFQANISSSNLFMLPGGPLGAALGYEYRSLWGSHIPGSYAIHDQAAAVGGQKPTAGAYDVRSAYTEVKVPLVQNVTGVQHLGIDVAARYSRFSSFGSNTTKQAGIRYNPIQDLLIRGTISEGFRAPNIYELAAGRGSGFVVLTDPCDARDPSRPASCSAAGVPETYNQISPRMRIYSGGNSNLKPESSLSKTVGFVYSPSQVPGFNISADYYHIEVDNLITTVGGQNIFDGCYRGGNADFCSLISRNAEGRVLELLNINVNFGSLVTDGYEISSRYHLPTDFGDFTFRLNSDFLKTFNEITPVPGKPPTVYHDAGWEPGGYPENRTNLSVNWAYSDFDVTLAARYIGDMRENCTPYVSFGVCSDPEPVYYNQQRTRKIPTNHIGATVYYDAQVTYHYGPASFTLGARNIFGRKPPIELTASSNSYDSFLYDLPGRFLYARASVLF